MKKKTKYSMAFSATDAVMYLLLLFPITTLFQTNIVILNRIVFFFTYLTLLFALYSKANTVRLIALPVMVFLYVWASFHTNFPLFTINIFFYFQFMVLYSLLFLTKRTAVESFFKRNPKYVYGVIYLWCAIIAICAVVPSSYPYHMFYFKPLGLNGFRSAPTAIFILCLIMLAMVLYKNRRLIVFSVFPMYVIFAGSSRTYFLVGVLIFIILFYIYCKGKQKFYIYAIPGVAVGYKAYSLTSVSDKMTALTANSGTKETFWYNLSNGRSAFWKVDINAYRHFSIDKLLFGNGFNYVYELNKREMNNAIWAHNDFINLLLGFGAVGTLIYVACIVALIVFVMFKGKCKIPVLIVVTVVTIWLFNAYFNMFYTYFCACASYPFLLLAVNHYYTERAELDKLRETQEAELHRAALEARRKRGIRA